MRPRTYAKTIQGPFFAFAAVVAGVAAWSIWGQDIFPSQDPTGGALLHSNISTWELTDIYKDPETWTHDQCVTWLKHVSPLQPHCDEGEMIAVATS